MNNKRKALPAFDDRAPRDRYCDLILTGGVTSSIAYPGAVFALAMAYRFNSIGGSSSGAGVAALAAAAEYRRRHGSADGFRILLERVDAVADKVGGHTGLEWLFQPEAGQGRLFRALLEGFARPAGGVICGLAHGLAKAYIWPMLGGVAIAIALFLALGGPAAWAQPLVWIAFVALALLGAAIALAIFLRRDLQRLVRNDFGLCTGKSQQAGAPRAPLTPWLHELIQEVAGRGPADAPLTFADLSDAPGSPRETLGDFSHAGKESIRLQMFTANVTHGRPYLLPQDAHDTPLFFRPSEMRRLFPARVVRHMLKHSKRIADSHRIIEPTLPEGRLRWPWAVRRTAAQERQAGAAVQRVSHALRSLPREQLPLIVACRMSVSFPVLFSAVPLWSLDDAGPGLPAYRRSLFADGGLCSNFPIHLFDSPIPAWPTFGISLHDLVGEEEEKYDFCNHDDHDPDFDRLVTLPPCDAAAPPERRHPLQTKGGTWAQLTEFAFASFSTVKDWNDATLARMPGVRERVVQMSLRSGIGGLNIRMDSCQIRWLATLGVVAARKLLVRYARASNANGLARGWEEHRWLRFNVLAESLAESLSGFSASAAGGRHVRPMAEQLRQATEEPPLGADHGPRLLGAEAAALEGVLAALAQTERALTARAGQQPRDPQPRPRLRTRPPL